MSPQRVSYNPRQTSSTGLGNFLHTFRDLIWPFRPTSGLDSARKVQKSAFHDVTLGDRKVVSTFGFAFQVPEVVNSTTGGGVLAFSANFRSVKRPYPLPLRLTLTPYLYASPLLLTITHYPHALSLRLTLIPNINPVPMRLTHSPDPYLSPYSLPLPLTLTPFPYPSPITLTPPLTPYLHPLPLRQTLTP